MKKRSGTTMMELVVAMGVIIVGLLTVMGLIVRSIDLSTRTKNELVALGLAQEGVEAVRSIRDANFLEINSGKLAASSWNYHLFACPGGFNPDGTCSQAGDYDFIGTPVQTLTSVDPQDFVISAWDMNFVANETEHQDAEVRKVDSLFVNVTAGAGERTGFRRLIYIIPLCGPVASVSPLTTVLGMAREDLNQVVDTDISTNCPDWIGVRVVSHVEWRDRASTQDVEVTQDLYNWR